MPLWIRMSDGMQKLSKSNLQNEKSSSLLKWKHQSRNDSRLSRFVTYKPMLVTNTLEKIMLVTKIFSTNITDILT